MYNNEFTIENVMQKIHNQNFEKWVDNFSKKSTKHMERKFCKKAKSRWEK